MLNKTKVFDYAFLATGLLVQIITYWIAPSGVWSLISGLCGICSVVLCAQGNILYYIFGFAQVITYTYLCVVEHFYAEIAMNVFYFVTMIYGVCMASPTQYRLGGEEQSADAPTAPQYFRMAVGGMHLAVGIVRVAAEPLHRRPAALPRCVHHGAGSLCADTDDIGLSRAVVSMDGGQCAGVLHVAESRRLLHRRAIPLLVRQLRLWLLPLDESAERIKDAG